MEKEQKQRPEMIRLTVGDTDHRIEINDAKELGLKILNLVQRHRRDQRLGMLEAELFDNLEERKRLFELKKEYGSRITETIKNRHKEAQALRVQIHSPFNILSRFYEQSLHAYAAQEDSIRIAEFFRDVSRGAAFGKQIEALLSYGTGINFDMHRSNALWQFEAKNIVETYTHLVTFLDAFISVATDLNEGGKPSLYAWRLMEKLFDM